MVVVPIIGALALAGSSPTLGAFGSAGAIKIVPTHSAKSVQLTGPGSGVWRFQTVGKGRIVLRIGYLSPWRLPVPKQPASSPFRS